MTENKKQQTQQTQQSGKPIYKSKARLNVHIKVSGKGGKRK